MQLLLNHLHLLLQLHVLCFRHHPTPPIACSLRRWRLACSRPSPAPARRRGCSSRPAVATSLAATTHTGQLGLFVVFGCAQGLHLLPKPILEHAAKLNRCDMDHTIFLDVVSRGVAEDEQHVVSELVRGGQHARLDEGFDGPQVHGLLHHRRVVGQVQPFPVHGDGEPRTRRMPLHVAQHTQALAHVLVEPHRLLLPQGDFLQVGREFAHPPRLGLPRDNK
mmetsp:Transcript_66375/g.130141  ORF Transcript_66375/g.130141 Transcript_66375/m.130141 type:complete len:221 (+) Transcript_66375:853-1515(+)